MKLRRAAEFGGGHSSGILRENRQELARCPKFRVLIESHRFPSCGLSRRQLAAYE